LHASLSAYTAAARSLLHPRYRFRLTGAAAPAFVRARYPCQAAVAGGVTAPLLFAHCGSAVEPRRAAPFASKRQRLPGSGSGGRVNGARSKVPPRREPDTRGSNSGDQVVGSAATCCREKRRRCGLPFRKLRGCPTRRPHRPRQGAAGAAVGEAFPPRPPTRSSGESPRRDTPWATVPIHPPVPP
jgi:hypothetical protein